MVTFIFTLGLRKGQYQAKLGQIMSNLQFLNFPTKHAYLVQFCFRIQKCHLLLCTAIRNVKNAIQDVKK